MDSQILILGVGCILLCDEGFGVRTAKEMEARYTFPPNVSVVDGGVLGINLLGVISQADHLIVLDAIKNGGEPGTVYRIDDDGIPERIRAKNSLHQIDFLEALTLCHQGLDCHPKTVIFGVEPQDIETYQVELSPVVAEQTEKVIGLVLDELRQLGVEYSERSEYVPGHPF